MAYSVTINYDLSIQKMIQCGGYDCDSVSNYITAEDFPISGEGVHEVKLELVYFSDQWMGSDDVLQEFAKAGLEAARIEHLLAFGAKYPELQKQFTIIALGSVCWDPEGHHVLGLDEFSNKRWLCFYPFDEVQWHPDHRFLAIRK